ncbi:MAG: transpeptidase family protein [Bacteroides sp.]|nr:transpeptidase family protein [Bacteroides sp.]MCM1413771.1 transpeptidase family protein [Bacteroides sp.]MCM1472210.1 transpeptidase family protein [Bacteroides sp.]
MKRENRKNILFRYGLIISAIILLSIVIIYRLMDNTMFSADKWNANAEKTLSKLDTIMPVRGDILGCDGTVLATNMIIYTPMIDFRVPKFNEKLYRDSLNRLCDSMAKHFPVRDSDGWKEYLSKPLAKKKENRPRAFPVLRKISYDDSQLLKTFPFFNQKKRYSGLHIDSELARVRPYGEMARRSIGAVGETDDDRRRRGIYGLEKSLDSLLAGTPGISKKVRLTNAIVDWADREPIDGYDVMTTIDIKMQDIVENELNKVLEVCKADWGTAIMMEVGTGDIKAIANLEYDIKRGYYIESQDYAVNRYEPGSVVKTLSLMIAMEDGRAPSLDKVYTTGGSFKISGFSTSDCSKSDTLSLRRALEISSNIVMSKMILEAYGDDPGRFYSRIRRSGFLDRFNTGIAGEVPPRIDSLAKTNKLSLTRQSFGYGTEISPLYTCALYNAIAGGGRFVRPRLVKGLRGNGVDTIFDVSYVRDRICSEETARELRDMLHRVVWGPRGTARSVLKSDKVEIAGKTGTANIIVDKKYAKGVNRLAFCGFFPYDNPRYTCMVLISYPKETWISPATTSGRVVKNIAEAMYARGMLGNNSDFRSAGSKVGDHPTYYGSNDDRMKKANKTIGAPTMATLSKPHRVKSGVPDVVGLGLREAIRDLESAGYNVSFTGTGYVSGQLPTAGTPSKPGTTVNLVLRE